MVRTIAAAAALTIAGSALAVPQGAFWVEVDNTAGNAADLTGATTVGQRTFNLYVQLEAGDRLFAADFGIAGPNAGLTTTQTVWQSPTGTDFDKAPLGFDANVIWDTVVALGDADGQTGGIGGVGGIDWNPAGFNGAWFAAVPLPGQGNPDFGNAAWMARITLSSAGGYLAETGLSEFLGGQFFVSGTGPNGDFGQAIPSNGVVTVGNAFPIPTPGALALFGLAGAAATRRRR